MSDEENTQTDVGAADTEPPAAEAAPAEAEAAPAAAPIVISQPDYVRVGGRAGVRVTEQGELQTVKRVRGGNDDSPLGDSKLVPCAVLAEVRQTLDEQTAQQLTAAERIRAVRDLLAPWL